DDEPNPRTRRQRAGLTVSTVGPAPHLGAKEFAVGEGTCHGDSGGPAVAVSGAVLGALSRGTSTTGREDAAGCLGAVNVFTSVARHADLVRDGYARVGQAPWLEGRPSPLLAKSDEGCSAGRDRGRPRSAIALVLCTLAVLFASRR